MVSTAVMRAMARKLEIELPDARRKVTRAAQTFDSIRQKLYDEQAAFELHRIRLRTGPATEARRAFFLRGAGQTGSSLLRLEAELRASRGAFDEASAVWSGKHSAQKMCEDISREAAAARARFAADENDQALSEIYACIRQQDRTHPRDAGYPAAFGSEPAERQDDVLSFEWQAPNGAPLSVRASGGAEVMVEIRADSEGARVLNQNERELSRAIRKRGVRLRSMKINTKGQGEPA